MKSLAFLLALVSAMPTLRAAEPHRPPPREHKLEEIFVNDAIDDSALVDTLTAVSVKLIKEGGIVKMTKLAEGLNRRQCVARLCAASREKVASVDLIARERPAVVVIASPYRCKDCGQIHIGTSTGFFISPDGLIATCRHVASSPDDKTMIVMMADGRILPVKEVVAADETDDVAVLKVEGSDFPTLSLVESAPVGASVRVISHPDEHFYSLTEGYISRYSQYAEQDKKKTRVMTITADFAKGSSGGPVFDESGNVVGMVASTESIYYDEDAKGKQTDLQMVFKHCTPSAAILKLIKK